jgi:hypothetical protein
VSNLGRPPTLQLKAFYQGIVICMDSKTHIVIIEQSVTVTMNRTRIAI